MGKLSLKRKEEPEKQQKISSFFSQKPQGQVKKPDESPLFQTVTNAGSTLKQQPQTLVKNTTSAISIDHPSPGGQCSRGSVRTVIPETQCNVTPVRNRPDNAENGTSENGDSDCDIIPATPDVAPAVSKSRSFGRSFLSSSLSHLAPGVKPRDKASKIAAPKTGTVKCNKKTAKSKTAKNQKGSWSSNDSTMCRVLNDMGLPEAARSGLGLESASASSMCVQISGATNKGGINTNQNSAKRIRSSEDGESPPYKKKQIVNSDLQNRESPADTKEGISGKENISQDLNDGKNAEMGNNTKVVKTGILGAGTRARLILENSLKVGVRTNSDSESGCEEESEDDSAGQEQEEKGIVGNTDDKERKFSFNKNSIRKKSRAVGVKGASKDFGKNGKVDENNQEGNDKVLDDILGKLKRPAKQCTDSGDVISAAVPSMVLLKKKKNCAEVKERQHERMSRMGISGGGGDVAKEKPMIDHTETDDALQDIMAELKETLTEQNARSAGKCSSKKKQQYVHREKEMRLNNSISKQLDFNCTNRQKTTGRQTADASSSENDDITPLDGHVTDSKACNSLFQEDSWMDDAELVNLDMTTSPFKEKLGQSCDKSRYDPSANRAPAQAFGRHVVKQVETQGSDVVLTVEPMQGGNDRMVILQGYWTDTHVAVGDVIHVIGEFDADATCHVTDQQNFVVVNPDLLISGTSVVSTVYCMRKSVLNEKFKGVDNRSVHMLHGSIIHAFFQEVLQQRHLGHTPSMEEVGNAVLKQTGFLHEMYGLGVTQDSVMGEIGKFFPQVSKFLDMYLSKSGPGKAKDVEIQEVKDIEENVWSPRFGVKGKIDLTVEVKIHSERSGQRGQSKLMPLELKTGKASFSVEHKGQVTLYSMMSSDRREDPGGGLLLYLREGQMRTIPAHYSHKRGLIQLRNELAHFLRSSSCRDEEGQFSELPPPISNERSCAKCPHLLNCTAYSSVIEKRSFPPTHAMNKLKDQSLGHLTSEHLQYFSTWCELMHLELGATRSKGVNLLWCKTAYERETQGEALCGMVLSPQHCHSTSAEKVIQCFERHPHSTRTSLLTDVGLTRGDSVVVSAENKPLIALCMGNVQEISDTRVSLLVDRDLRKVAEYKDLIYRLDKCDTYNTMATNFTNLSRLMENSDVGDKLRELIIEKRPPQFELTISRTSVEKVKRIFKQLNKPQKTAILKVLMCQDYVLIKGYPGTGKTSTIVALVRILSLLGVSVLLTSYTHSAVDNILLKLKQFGVGFVRLGRVERIHPDIQPHAAEVLTRQLSTVQQLEEFYSKQQVVATTCLGTNHVLFVRRRFDLCVVDEASQVLQPACLGPLFVSNKFVLVGDPRQLPPVVQSREARDKGMAESLFARLDSTGGTYELNVQYRMNSEIVRLSNELVYEGALQCGSEAVASGRLRYDKSKPKDLPGWCSLAISDEPGHEVIFLNTEKIDCTGVEDGRVKNELEASIVRHLIQVFIQLGISQSDLGVIAPYRQQVLLLRDLLSKNQGQVEVNTVDQYQGRDKQVIVMSFVKQGTPTSQAGGILEDLRRLNVALTRAKYKLILIGHIPTLTQFDPLQQVVNILRANQIIQIPAVFGVKLDFSA